jgi:hypothetical protein
MAKTRPAGNPYAVFQAAGGSWEWRVLKVWQADSTKPYARWFCSVKSPFTGGGSDMGDTYADDVLRQGTLVDWDRDLLGGDALTALDALRDQANMKVGA